MFGARLNDAVPVRLGEYTPSHVSGCRASGRSFRGISIGRNRGSSQRAMRCACDVVVTGRGAFGDAVGVLRGLPLADRKIRLCEVAQKAGQLRTPA